MPQSQSHALSHAQQIDNWLLQRLHSGITGFEALLRHLPSVYPTEVLAGISRLQAREAVTEQQAELLRLEASTHQPHTVTAWPELPLPHPLNYEWRFSQAGASELLQRACDLSMDDDKVLLLGTPTLALAALRGETHRQWLFIGEDNPVARCVIDLQSNLRHSLKAQVCGEVPALQGEADVVVLDPPWYMDYIRGMLTVAASCCRTGGYILVSLPPDGVRASAREERRSTYRFAERLGLARIGEPSVPLNYETPFFERNALKISGCHVSGNWRHGQLTVLRKLKSAAPIPHIPMPRHPLWAEVPLGRMRLFVKLDIDLPSESKRLLTPVVPEEILPTVSRRDPRRSQANVWTSGNRVFFSERPDLVLKAAHLAQRLDPASWRGSSYARIEVPESLEQLAQRLRELASVEETEERADCELETARGQRGPFDPGTLQ